MPDQPEQNVTTPVHHEDSFFVLRDCREIFVRRLVDILKESIIVPATVIEAFAGEIGKAHDELATATQQDGFGLTAGLTASRISLVGNDDLELEIRIGNIANHLKGNERIEHWRVQLRYMTLLHQPKMSMENNPVGFEPICQGLWSICDEGGNTLDQKLDRLDRLEEQLQLRLPDLYVELYDLLERHHVEPAQIQAIQRGSSGKPPMSSGSGGPGVSTSSTDALSALQQAMHQQLGADDVVPAGFLTGNTAGDSAGGTGNVMLNASTLIMLNHLMERLRVLESQQISALTSNASDNMGEQQPLCALRSKDLDLPLGKPAAIALDTLSLIFEAIFAAPDLPDAVKAAIGRLQIPLLKLAIIDTSFFSDTKHPARRLVNRMARAAIGLDQDTGRDHAVCISLGKLADAVRSTLETNEADLSPHLAEIEALIAERDQSLQTVAQAYVQLVLEHENREASRSGAQDWLDKALARTAQPAVRAFLSDYWLRVMQAACSDGGLTGSLWKEFDNAIEQLLWSFEPKQTAEERKTLLSLIPSLLKRINAGLDLLGVSSEERTPFLNTCFDLQTASLRSRPDVAILRAELPPTPINRSATSGTLSVQILERDGKLVQYLGQPTAAQSPWRTGGSAWKDGDWISFRLPDGEHLCGRYCWQGSPSGTILLFNPGWGYAVALASALLEQQLRDGRARIVSESSLFDDAAERALSQMIPR